MRVHDKITFSEVNFPVFHIMDRNNGPSNVERLTMANFYVQSFYVEFIRLTLLQQSVQGKRGRMHITDLRSRTGCSFEYIGGGFTCANKDEVVNILSRYLL